MELAERLQELRADRRHGASFLARRAVEALVEVAEAPAATSEELLGRVTSAGRQLAAPRPGIAAVAGAVGRLLAAARAQAHLPPPELRRLIEQESEALVASRRRAAASIAIQLAERLEGARWSSLTRPRRPCARLSCTRRRSVSPAPSPTRSRRGEPSPRSSAVELVEDEEAPAKLAAASLLLVGADTVFRDGTLCNKIGTRTLAEAAAELGVPTVVACDVIKLAPIESAKARELPREVRELFDLTPPELVHAVVTEEGTVSSDEVHALVDRTPFLRQATRCSGELPKQTVVHQSATGPPISRSLTDA